MATLIVGPDQHGVVIFARRLVEHAEGPVLTSVDQLPADVRLVHLHFTDRLFGDSCEASAAAIEALASQLPVLAVTLHDLPMASDAPDRYRRRAAAYRRVAAAAALVVVSSQHEAALLRACAPDVSAAVIPLPIDAGAPVRSRPEPDRQVAILGFLYPGKGHAEALEAMSQLPAEFGLTALGRPADGHQDYQAVLADQAARLGRSCSVTGWLPDAELAVRMSQTAIPLVAHRQLSASGSIGSWLAAGRRPLVPDGPYTQELAARCPGSVTRYKDADLAGALLRAAADPESTWLAPDVRLGPNSAEVAASYRALLARHAGRQTRR